MSFIDTNSQFFEWVMGGNTGIDSVRFIASGLSNGLAWWASSAALIVFIWKSISNSIEKLEDGASFKFYWDWKTLIRVCVLVFFVSNYASLVTPLNAISNGIIGSCTKELRKSEIGYTNQKFIQYVISSEYNFNKEDLEYLTDTKNLTGSIEGNESMLNEYIASNNIDKNENVISVMSLDIDEFLNKLLNGVAAVAMYIVKFVLGGLIIGLSKITLGLGALAFAASIIPHWQDTWKRWLSFYATVKATIITFMALEHLNDSFVRELLISKTAGSGNDINNYIALASTLSTVIGTCLIFFITSRVIGTGDGGKFLSAAHSIGTGALMKGLGSAAKGLGDTAKGIGKAMMPSGKGGSTSEAAGNVGKSSFEG